MWEVLVSKPGDRLPLQTVSLLSSYKQVLLHFTRKSCKTDPFDFPVACCLETGMATKETHHSLQRSGEDGFCSIITKVVK
jgi:hypothetical protein